MSKGKVKRRARQSKNKRNLPSNRITKKNKRLHKRTNKKTSVKRNIYANKNVQNRCVNEETKKIEKNKIKKEKKSINKKKIILIIFILLIIISFFGILWYLENVVFIAKELVEIEVGTKTEIDVREFLKDYNLEGEIKLLTDTSKIDFNKIAEYDIEFEFKNRKYNSKLQFVDTVPPVVEFKNVDSYIDYVFNPNDFIVSKTDVTEMTVEIENQPEITQFRQYPIVIVVRDAGGNETIGNVILNTSYIKTEYTLELGTPLTHEALLSNPVGDRDVLPQSELDRINTSPVGDYEIITSNRGTQVTTKIKVQDTTPPVLALKEVTIYNDQTTLDKSAFIENVTDFSETTTELKTALPFGQVGTHDVQIEAKDIYGNATTQGTKLNIIKDTVGPVISGLGSLSVGKNAAVDWNRGVSSKDAKDGACTFTVDTSSVNLGVAGTYVATYISKDNAGNTTKKTRTITVNPDANDVYNKASEWLSRTGTDPISIKNYVAHTIKYNGNTNRNSLWGAWVGFTSLRGDCYVHAATTNMLLQKAGYSCMIVNATDNSHYWNLVNVGGVWRHLDSTPPTYCNSGLMTDAERFATLRGKDWNRAAFPPAE